MVKRAQRADWCRWLVISIASVSTISALYVLVLLLAMQNTFQDPVIAADGRTYERSEINQWLAKGDLSPWTLMPLAHLRVETDIQVQAQLDMLNAYRSEITAQRLADL